ncbi:hypothetical protein ANCCEY_09587 [Ancylostoma ceylanicum]|uniref:PEST proteolytic signal-containing nuclear protein n=2 Tax=Ancylostoma ceylanicum TaxID=53326 RepID=A0A8I3B0N3_9BILA|nr:hypothetical protein ANCCEY_09587 [Ancylostoma ceylanicum]EYC30926.1 hypothetical protein Y032_0004g1854 [Ancylostoma ceylanicum]
MSTNNTDDHKFVSPVARPTDTPPSSESSENQTAEAKAIAAAKKETPIAVRTRRHFQQELHMSSPSDAQLSPCTTKLFGKGGKKMTSGPTAILRNKQQSAIPFNLND